MLTTTSSRMGLSVRAACVALLLLPAASAQGQTRAAVIVEAFATAVQRGPLSDKPLGVGAIATLPSGAGIGARWGTSDDVDYWSLTFTQLSPNVRGRKSVQPLFAVGICGVTMPGLRSTCLELAGGLRIFLGGHIGFGVDFRYLHDLHTFGDCADDLCEKQVSLALAWRF